MTSAVAVLTFWVAYSSVERSSIRDALSDIESGGNDHAKGAAHEVSRYQIKPSVWREHCRNYPITRATDPTIAWVAVASKVLDARVEAYHKVMGKRPSFFDLYALWHRPSRFYDPKTKTYNLNQLTKRERERCTRFAALVEDALKKGNQ